MKTEMLTFDIVFNDNENSSNKGFNLSFEDAKKYIDNVKGSSYYEDYKGGTVSAVCNETGETVIEKAI